MGRGRKGIEIDCGIKLRGLCGAKRRFKVETNHNAKDDRVTLPWKLDVF